MKQEKIFVRMYAYGKDDEYNYMVMTCMGKNLDSLLK